MTGKMKPDTISQKNKLIIIESMNMS